MAKSFLHVNYPEPHLRRTKVILAQHPEIKTLFGNTPSTALSILGLVALQIGLAWVLRDTSFWPLFAVAFVVGAVANHALWTMIHDCTHNLVFKGSTANKWMQIFANLPIVFPGAISFRIYHLVHHRHQGDPTLDADLATDFEARFAGNVWWRKALWLLLFPVWQPFRIARLNINSVNAWVIVNVVVEVSFLAALTVLAHSGMPLLYLFISSVFAVGLHPVGARWIQEHYTVNGGNQETYSYYGPLNLVAFNVGYHNEHHDFMMVPWSRLPQVRAMAPAHYNELSYHESWTKLLMRFLFDPSITLKSRITRGEASAMASSAPATESLAARS